MKINDLLTIKEIKKLGKDKSDENIKILLKYFNQEISIELKREIVSSIGRQINNDMIYSFLRENAFKNHPMEVVYQMYRTCLYKEKIDERFKKLGVEIKDFYKNENIYKMYKYYQYKQLRIKRNVNKEKINRPTILIGDTEKTLTNLPEESIQMIFTSPPYYNAREYSDYHSYNEYLLKIKNVFKACSRVLEDGRFMIVNISPVITKRPGREFESIRYPIHYDYHKILEEAGFYFIDEIIWIKPEPSVPNRIGGYMQTRKPLSYKPNCITESLMVYRKNCDFLLDKNINDYGDDYDKFEEDEIDTTNCWYISPRSDKNHPAVFPEELCRRVLKYYSYEKDVIMDPFAGSGTLGKVAKEMGRIPVMCEINEKYIDLIKNEEKNYYDYISE
ncbi:site-specific DNA-methyltransferase [uncultured Tyzzerella sp.]|uniref:DNA-methyltransferase n=1 Tax=uncultured Tyzzerella sp. TaxID=2321398 RepID=UPI00294391BC|nr:site-specific DNA-methyltransferase [uncultured Tyzzerella sp.]